MMPEYLSTDPNAGEYLSSDPMAGTEEPLPSRMNQQELRQGKAESFWESARRKLVEAFAGTPEHRQLRAEGVGLQPNLAEMGDAALHGAGAMAGGALMGAGAAAFPAMSKVLPVTAKVIAPIAGSAIGEEFGRRVAGPRGAMIGGIAGAVISGHPEAMFRGGGTSGLLKTAIKSGAKELAGKAEGAAAKAAVKQTAEEAANAVKRKVIELHRLGVEPGRIAETITKTFTHLKPSEANAAVSSVLRLGSEAAPAAGPAVAQAAKYSAEEVSQKILSLKQRGLSGAQITRSLKDVFGIKPSDGQKMVSMVLGLK